MTDLILTEDDYRQMVQPQEGKPTTDSLKVGMKFGKRHDNVLQSIDRLKCSDKFRLLNFQETVIWRENPSGGEPIKSRSFNMSKDGFMFLVMGLTGAKAGVWKEAFIEAFNWMAEELKTRNLSYEQRRNHLMAEYQQEKGLASFAGKTMRRWQLKKPMIEGKLMAIDHDGQHILQLH
ncbi:Rha family transcriptional regulator [Pseudomonas sp. A1437]|uniref:Rha family transcriptional regulator n=1 Tax=unclassified Pseudomonas TaxID=196821 RepID=UPI0037838A05